MTITVHKILPRGNEGWWDGDLGVVGRIESNFWLGWLYLLSWNKFVQNCVRNSFKTIYNIICIFTRKLDLINICSTSRIVFIVNKMKLDKNRWSCPWSSEKSPVPLSGFFWGEGADSQIGVILEFFLSKAAWKWKNLDRDAPLVVRSHWATPTLTQRPTPTQKMINSIQPILSVYKSVSLSGSVNTPLDPPMKTAHRTLDVHPLRQNWKVAASPATCELKAGQPL